MNLNENQKKAIDHYNGNCCVMASAGSGKTTVLVERVKNLIDEHNIDPENILCITFSKKAKENMINRLGIEYSNVNIETFHSLGYKILKTQNSKYNLIKDYEQKQILSKVLINEMKVRENEINYNVILNFISYCKNNLISYTDNMPSNINKWNYETSALMRIYKHYEEQKENDNKIDFDDMLIKTYKLLLTDAIKKKYQNKFKYILIDEFQDTNKTQYELIKLLGKFNNNVFVVGDPLQNIYQWRAANNNYIIDFYKEWENTSIVNLNTNYRSIYNIVSLSNKLVEGTKETTHKNYVKSKSSKPKGMNPKFIIKENELEESKYIVSKIITQKYNYNDIAILCRTNNQMQTIESTFYNNKIPYEIIGGKSFYNQKEIIHMVSFLRLAINNNDDESFKIIYNVPNRYLGNIFLQEVISYANKYKMSLFDAMSNFPRSDEWRYKNGIYELERIIFKIGKRKRYKVGELINIIRSELNYDDYINNTIDVLSDIKNEKIDNLNSLVNLANEYNDVNEFLREVDSISSQENNNASDKVKIMTIHQSKGLEFKQVFVIGVNQGILPHKKSDNINEERRLLYVAMTRAEEELYISSLNEYNNKKLEISQFIYDVFDNAHKENKTKSKYKKK